MLTKRDRCSEMNGYHRPIMLREVIAGLDIRPNGVYFDGTAGGGGHSYAILASDPTVRLIATDKDGDAIAAASERLAPFCGRFSLYRSDFKSYADVLAAEGVDRLDGYLLDLGISSHQIDEPERGFAYMSEQAPLDMRMDDRAALTAADVVNGYPEESLVRILREYGEESYALPIAKRIVREREKERITTCGGLRAIVEASVPAKYRYNACARKTFQAIRIEVNGELEGLRECIRGLTRRLKPGGRGCIITFHSLEDRIVKQVFREMSESCTCPKSFPVCVCGKKREIEPVVKKPLVASDEEQRENPRSTSAKLRIVRKVE